MSSEVGHSSAASTVISPSSQAPARTPGIFRVIEELHGTRPWGAVLDGGTGPDSLGWINRLETTRWMAVTGSRQTAVRTIKSLGGRTRECDRIVVGNWTDPELLRGETFDTVVADYLLSAIDRVSPYWQDQLFPRLRPLVRERLYVIGLEPCGTAAPDDESAQVVTEMWRVKDACFLLAGERTYREYPLESVVRLLDVAGFRVVDTRRYPIRYKDDLVDNQIEGCLLRIPRFADPAVANALRAYVEHLRQRALALVARHSGIKYGHEYLIVAEPAGG